MKTNPKDYSVTTQVYATHSHGGNAAHINQVLAMLIIKSGYLLITV